jgi:hypothetical protein
MLAKRAHGLWLMAQTKKNSFSPVLYAIGYKLLLRCASRITRFTSLALLLLACTIAGCAGMGVPQQPRLEIGESAGLLQIQAPGTFFTSRLLSLEQERDGVVTVHSVSHSSSAPPTLPAPQSLAEDALAQVNEALLPFLVPACDASGRRQF